MDSKTHRIIAIRDVIKPNFYGGDAYEFCVEHNEFHLAVPKGGIVEITEDAMINVRKTFNQYGMYWGKPNCSTGFEGNYNGRRMLLRTDDFIEI